MSTLVIACDTSYQKRGHAISIPLDCLVVEDDFLTSCDHLIAIASVAQAPRWYNYMQRIYISVIEYLTQHIHNNYSNI